MAVRLTVKVSDATYSTLQALAAKDETTMTEVLRRALAVYNYLDSSKKDSATEIVIREPDGTNKVLALPA